MKKKIITSIISVVLSVSMVVPAFASEEIGSEFVEDIIAEDVSEDITVDEFSEEFVGKEIVLEENAVDDENAESLVEIPEILVEDEATVLASGSCGENAAWTITNDNTLTITGSGDMETHPWDGYKTYIKTVVIQSGITSIGDDVFEECSNLTSVNIPDSVTNIGNDAFWECRNLTNINIPDNVSNIGSYAFYYCRSLTSIRIPNSVTNIGSYAFSGCSNLTSINIPDNVTSIGYNTFRGCSSLSSISIPNSITSIGKSAFYKCSSLTSIIIPDSVTEIEERAFSECSSLETVEISDILLSTIDYSNIFYGTKWKLKKKGGDSGAYDDIFWTLDTNGKLEINGTGTIKSLGNDYEYLGHIKEVIIYDGINRIGDEAFYGCSGLISITIPNSVTSIGSSAFERCSGLTSITIPNSVTEIRNWAFAYCNSLASIIIPNSVRDIGYHVFYESDNVIIYGYVNSCAHEYALEYDFPFVAINTSSYNIAFEGNGATSGKMSRMDNCYVGMYISLTKNKYNRKGYTFDSWNTKADGTGTLYRDGVSVTDLTDVDGATVVLYAQWKPNKYKIVFNANGGTGSMNSIAAVYDSKYTLPKNVFTRNGYEFKEWNSEPDGEGGSFTDGRTVKNLTYANNDTVILYAQWTSSVKYKITYNLNGGKNNSKNPKYYGGLTEDITLKNPTKTGYTFKGWYTDSKLTKKVTVIKKGSTGNKTLYAKWAANKYTIKFNANGGRGTMKNKSMTYDKKAKLTKNAFTRKGYTFLGWSTDKKATKAKYKNATEVKNLTSKNNGTVTLYAVWKKK